MQYIVVRSAKCCNPFHNTVTPGALSLGRSRKPPRRAIQCTAWRNVGGMSGGVGVRWMAQYSACHSSRARRTVQGNSGKARLSRVAYRMRHARML